MQRLFGPFSALWKYGSLTHELARRDILGRYRGASFGLAWSLISPFLMLCVYTFAFGVILKSKWPQVAGGDHPFAIILFVGLIVHGFFSECLSRSPTLITGNPGFVKKVVFPLEIFPWQIVLSALFQAGTNLLVFIMLRLLLEGTVSWTIVFIPVVFVPLVCLSLGVSWIFAALGVYLRDINQVTGVLATAMLFLSSAMIPVQTLPEHSRILFHLNPLTFLIDQARAVALWGQYPDWSGLLAYTLGGLVLMYLGYAWFMATKRGFADVL
ncbi:ABC transporter permease [Aerosticca soli]|uniref:Transport permease protein n=1 Tax=Aerosticca soli TaxID=2010829 RepID=A0A2Z6E1K8_9GAMM|nr:ABC transporter permease [Aerosticca soli]BBD78875.1 O-antigen export system permease protein RfbD [Aerosticca soli]